MTINATITAAAIPNNRNGGFGKFMLMTVGGWLFMSSAGRKVDQIATMTKSSNFEMRDE